MVNVWPDNPMGYSSERHPRALPVDVSRSSSRRTDPKTLYVTSQHVWKTTNEGQSWERISPDLTRHDPSTHGAVRRADHARPDRRRNLRRRSSPSRPSPLDGNVIWAGSDDGLVHVTRDGGKTWTNVTPPDLPEFARISLIEASPHEAGTAYLAANRYQRADRAPYVYKTSDYGKTWTKIVTGIRRRRLRAGRSARTRSGRGCCSSAPSTASTSRSTTARNWQSLRLDLPVTPVHGIVVKEQRPRDRHARPRRST